ncbi:MAG TPA: threonine/serine dehydratase [Longimicrobiales bacterium]
MTEQAHTAGDRLTIAEIRDAQGAIAGRIHRTPLLSFRALGERIGATAYVKAEVLQKTGSFKVRGALNKVRLLSDEERARGLIALSAGNHAQGVAYAAAAYGARATVVMPATAPLSKVAASRSYGAEVIQHGTVGDAFELSLRLQHEHGYTYIHPYDDLAIMAGQGTVGLEILEDLPDADVIVAGVGGGGLAVGVAAAARALRPSARVIGVEPERSAALTEALRAGKVVRIQGGETIADGLAAPQTGELVLELAPALLDDVVLVTEEELAEGVAFLLARGKLLAEAAGAAPIAALLAGKIAVRPGERVVAIASGGNVDLSRLAQLITR